MDSPPSVSRSVSRSQLFSELGHRFFLIFGMKLGIHKGWKVTEPDFSGKIPFAQIWAKRAQNGLKMGFSEFWQKSNPLMCTFFCLKWKNSWSSIILRKPHIREKSSSRVISQTSRPIRLQDSFNDYISWRSWYLTLIFCMQIDIHERKKPSVSLWGGHAQACPGLPRHARLCPILPEGALGSLRDGM